MARKQLHAKTNVSQWVSLSTVSAVPPRSTHSHKFLLSRRVGGRRFDSRPGCKRPPTHTWCKSTGNERPSWSTSPRTSVIGPLFRDNASAHTWAPTSDFTPAGSAHPSPPQHPTDSVFFPPPRWGRHVILGSGSELQVHCDTFSRH